MNERKVIDQELLEDLIAGLMKSHPDKCKYCNCHCDTKSSNNLECATKAIERTLVTDVFASTELP